MSPKASIAFDNSYARLPGSFFAHAEPAQAPDPKLLRLNDALARILGIDPDWLVSPDGIALLSGKKVPDNSTPLAMAYAGHQFGNFVPQLGDGRAILLGEVIGTDGVRRDFQLKGAGRTPFSRGGDGRAVLGPVLREYIVSEAMAALGVPTTRSLAAIATGESVWREDVQPGALLVRVAKSHVRIGTFQFFAARGDVQALRQLADYVVARHYPAAADSENPYRALLEAIVVAQAELIARWQSIGFIHGVMNTDNMSIAGETIDYGPCAFMDEYHPSTVFSSIDQTGRYSYGNQPYIAHWNLVRLAEALLPLLCADQDKALELAQAAINAYPAHFERSHLSNMRAKLGLTQSQDEDGGLIKELLDLMAEGKADFTLLFRHLADLAEEETGAETVAHSLFATPEAFDAWLARWRARLTEEPMPAAKRQAAMRAVNPAYIPRNHLVEEVIQAALNDGDLAPFHELMEVLASPYNSRTEHECFAQPPRADQVVHQTFCGT